MPLDSRYQQPLVSAYAWLGAWGVWAIWTGLSGGDLAAPGMVGLHFALLGVGFAGNLLIGLGHHLVSHFSLRKAPTRWALSAESLLASAAALLAAVALVVPEGAALLSLASWIWVAALTAFAISLIAQLAPRPLTAANPYRAGLAGDKTSDLLLFVVAAYVVFAAAAAAMHGMMAAPAVHLWLVGVVATSIFMVAHRVLPRFSSRWLPTWIHGVQGALASVGPVVLAAGMGHSTRLALWGGAIEYLAIVLYMVLTGYAWRHRKNRHPALAFPALGAAFLFLGVNLGIWFLRDARQYAHLGIHAVNNLWGFVILTALGMGSAMLGLGVMAAPERPNRRVWRVGFAAVAALALWEAFSWHGFSAATVFGDVLGVLAIIQASWGVRLRFAGRPLIPRPL